VSRISAKSVKVSKLFFLATQYCDSAVSDAEIRKENVTASLLEELEYRISHGHLVNIQILGQTTDGKSTLMIVLLIYCLSLMHKRFSLSNIAGDQVEFLRRISEPSLNHTVIGIDEWNALGGTGLNATTEETQFQYYSDVQAQRYIHKIACSPSVVVDPNADVVLQVVSIDKVAKRTYFTISVRLVRPEGQMFQLVGMGSVDVSVALAHPVYAQYRNKKFLKMDLVTKEGVRDVRELEHACIIISVWDALYPLAAYSSISRDVCANYVEKCRHDQRELLSILTIDDIVRKSHGLLRLQRDICSLSLKCQRLESKCKAGEPLPEFLSVMKSGLLGMQKVRDDSLGYYRRMIEVYEKYKAI